MRELKFVREGRLELLSRYSCSRLLPSSDQGLLSVPRSHLKSRGVFEVVASNLWNSLPLSIKTAESLASFKLVSLS